jgi:glycosyltransferase involved in cell wall biosynthesis
MNQPMAIMMSASARQLVLIPSYNPGIKVYETVRAARQYWSPVWVVIDGSTDGSVEGLKAMAAEDAGLHIIHLQMNQGKGAAVLHGIELARAAGYTQVLTMDSDGQHPAELIPVFMARAAQAPDSMVLGMPIFDASAPRIRVNGRKLSNWWANVETLWAGIGDSLYGFRVYPIDALCEVMRRQPWMRHFDFDPEAVVRLSWYGVKAINIPAPVKYFRLDEDGVSHFRYLRDNILLTWMHARLLLEFLLRLPLLALRRMQQDARLNHAAVDGDDLS